MVEHPTEERQKPIGVIDAISMGYRLLSEYWYIVLVPIVVDLFFWLGPQVPLRDIFRMWMDALPQEVRQSMVELVGFSGNVEGMSGSPNVLTLLVEIPGAPASLAAALGGLPSPPGWVRPHYVPTTLMAAMGLMVGLLFLGTPLAGLYMALAAKAVPTVRTRMFSLPRLWLWTTGNLLALLALGLLLLVGITVVLGIGITLVALVLPAVVVGMLTLVGLLSVWISFMAMFFLYFTPASIASHGAGVVRALGESVIVVLRNMWSTLGLIIVIMIISQGFALIWARMFSGYVGGLISILGNAVLTSGLTVATVVFFHDRYMFWEREQRHLREQLAGQ